MSPHDRLSIGRPFPAQPAWTPTDGPRTTRESPSNRLGKPGVCFRPWRRPRIPEPAARARLGRSHRIPVGPQWPEAMRDSITLLITFYYQK
jgi:hypothetical protein